MPFSETIKLEVKRKSAFRCCRCQNIGVEIHHIIPEYENGPSDIDNAAPLCPKCHADFGDNPNKRKELRQMRDWWYEQAASMFKPLATLNPIIEKIDSLVLSVQKNEANVSELKSVLKAFSDRQIESITPDSLVATSTSIVNSASIEITQYKGSSWPVLSESGSIITDVTPSTNIDPDHLPIIKNISEE
ncbi:MAG: HNH endonuclease [bacterium]